MGTWRQTFGAIKDTTTLNLAKVNSEFKDMDIAIVKATSHVECLPKERYVRRLFVATSLSRPRSEVAYCIYALTRRLNKTHNWAVSLKTLIVIHRMLREGDPTFIEEILNYSQRGHILLVSNSKDDSSPLAWDCSGWIRNYALFLEERLECYRVLKYDIESERLLKNKEGGTKGHSKTRVLCCPDLLEQMPALQNLLFRLINCKPEGQACGNFLVQYALALVLKESFKIYCAINDGIINLVDMFFDLSKLDAVKAFEIYKRSGEQTENLSKLYGFCKTLALAKRFQFPTLQQPPPSFLSTMEEYIKEAPRGASNKYLEYDQNNIQANEEEENDFHQETQDLTKEVEEKSMPQENEESQPPGISHPEPEPEPDPEPEPATTGDLLGLESDLNPVAAEIEQNNALALAILQPGDESKSRLNMDLLGSSSSGWELALVTTPSNNTNHSVESKLAGGFDKLLLDSLYDDAARRQQIAAIGYYGGADSANPFDCSDPFAMSNSVAPPTNVQMALMQQEQHYSYQQQQYYLQHNNINMNMNMNTNMNAMVPYSQQPPFDQLGPTAGNPFADPFSGLTGLPPHTKI